ncbi:hypothetical protein AOLI_G00035900 [Acnodon oligacanthus]
MVDEVTLESSAETCLAWLFPPVVFKVKVSGLGGKSVTECSVPEILQKGEKHASQQLKKREFRIRTYPPHKTRQESPSHIMLFFPCVLGSSGDELAV